MRATLALVNGEIYTMNGRKTEAVAVSNTEIIKVGNESEIEPLLDSKTRVIDLKGRTVLPGFNDSHIHLMAYGFSINSVDLSGTKSIEEIKSRCQAFIMQNKIEPGEWILGRGWDQNLFDQKRFPESKDLDEISTQHPILLLRMCGHIGSVNTLALENAQVTRDTYIEGGSIDKNANGELIGILREASLEWFKKERKPKPGKETLIKTIKKAAEGLLKVGVTSVHTEDSYDLGYSGSFYDIYEAYKLLNDKGELPIRIYQKVSLPHKKDLEEFLERGLRTGQGNDHYKIGPLKLWLDGTLGARTAALRQDYDDAPNNKGIMVYAKEELYEILHLAQKENIQICLHAIGDKALSVALDVYEKIQIEMPRKSRHRILHCLVGDSLLFNKMASLGIIASIQPVFPAYNWKMVESRLKGNRLKQSYPLKTLMDIGLKLSAGSDAPVTSPNPFLGIYTAVTRKDFKGFPEGGWLPEQCISVEDAIKIYTEGSAYSAFEENRKGTISEGKLADMVILNNNPFKVSTDEIKDIKVETTIVGGKVKYTVY